MQFPNSRNAFPDRRNSYNSPKIVIFFWNRKISLVFDLAGIYIYVYLYIYIYTYMFATMGPMGMQITYV